MLVIFVYHIVYTMLVVFVYLYCLHYVGSICICLFILFTLCSVSASMAQSRWPALFAI